VEDIIIKKTDFKEIPEQKIYSEKAIRTATFLGGPLVAGYFLTENFKVFNDLEKVKKTWIITIISTVVIFALIFLIPENINIPNVVFPVIYTAIVSYFLKQYQEKDINEHIKNGGEEFGWGRTIGISIAGCILTFAVIFSVLFAIETLGSSSYSEKSKTYGIMNHEIVYEDNVTVQETDKIAEAFEKTTFFDQYQTKFIHLKKEGNNYEISISCNQSIESDLTSYQAFVELRNDMQKYFPNNKIIFNLVVDNLENVVKRIE
jgi:L-lactate permease